MRASIDAALVAAVAMNFDLREARHFIIEPLPQPNRDTFKRRSSKAFDLVEQAVIEGVPAAFNGC